MWSLTHRAGIADLAPQITPYMTTKGERLTGFLTL